MGGNKNAIFLSKIYRDMKVQCVKRFEYLSMDLDHSIPVECNLFMTPFVGNILKDFQEKITDTKATPAAGYLFKVQDNKKLTKLP